MRRGRKTAPRFAGGAAMIAMMIISALMSVASAQQREPALPNPLPTNPLQSSPPPALPPAPQPPISAKKPEGFFDVIGQWWNKSAADLKAGMDQSAEDWRKLNEKAATDAAIANKNAADLLTKFPTAKIVEGHERCEIASNGSPDCIKAAEKICKANGFATGQSADIQSVRKCSVRALLEGSSSNAACHMETSVIRASCQSEPPR